MERSRAEYLLSRAIRLTAALGVRTFVVTICRFSRFFPECGVIVQILSQRSSFQSEACDSPL